MLWDPHKNPNRKEHRLALTETTEFETRDGRIFGCKVINYSGKGMCISVGAQLNPGEVIRLSSPSCYALVMWYKENKAGLKFVNAPRNTSR